MGNPFTGFARDPTTVADAPSVAGLQTAISNASSLHGVPVDVLTKVANTEAPFASWSQSATAAAYQEVGYTTSANGGNGGFFGLTPNLLGTMQEQADTAASKLRAYFDKFGSWGAAINYYNTGDPSRGYGTGEPKDVAPFDVGAAPSLPAIGTGPFNIKPGFGMFILAYPILWGTLYAMTYIGPGASRMAAVFAAGIAGAVVLSKGPEVKANLGL